MTNPGTDNAQYLCLGQHIFDQEENSLRKAVEPVKLPSLQISGDPPVKTVDTDSHSDKSEEIHGQNDSVTYIPIYFPCTFHVDTPARKKYYNSVLLVNVNVK